MAKAAKPPGKCIFCGATGLTKEHMWADWLRDYIPREMNEHTARSAVVFPDREEVNYKTRPGDAHSRRLYCVCATCNNGWMSRLQMEAKQFLVPMLEGRKTTLHKRAQKVIAAWITMMVMVAEFLDKGKVAIPQKDRTWLLNSGEPPAHWRIWIGNHQRQTQPLFTHNVLAFTDDPNHRITVDERRPANTQTSTICLGKHLLFHVMSSRIGKRLIRRWPLPRQIAPALSQIWPFRSSLVQWPGEFGLNDAGIRLLAEQFFSSAIRYTRDAIAAEANYSGLIRL